MTIEKEFLERMTEFIKAYGEADDLEITAIITATSKDNDTVSSVISGTNTSEKTILSRTVEVLKKTINYNK